jgi:hypothetical protein
MPGASNCVADALSRVPAKWSEIDSHPDSTFMALVTIPTFGIAQQLQKENDSYPFLLAFYQQHAEGILSIPYSIVNGLVLHKIQTT